MLKILHIVNSFLPEYLGTAIRLYNLLSKQPYNIQLYAPDKTLKGEKIQRNEEQFANINVKRVSLDFHKGFIDAFPYLSSIQDINKKSKILVMHTQKEEFDIVHGHSHFVGSASKQLAKKTKKPLVYEVHVPITNRYSVRFNPVTFLASVYTKKREMDIMGFSDYIITLTQSLKDWVHNFYNISKEKIIVIPNGVDINKFAPKKEYKKEAEELKERLNLSDNIIMYAGYMDQINGMIDLADVIPSIIKEKTDTNFVFIGHGPEEDKIIALSKKYPQVNLLPTVHYDDIPVYYQMCDLFIIPRPSTISAETVTPLKLLEAMAMEKQVLGSNVGGIAEVIRHGENGYLFEKGNMKSFKKTLLEVIDADNTQIGKNARKNIAENYTWDKSAKILQKVYEELEKDGLPLMKDQ